MRGAGGDAADDLLLKVAPPRVPRHLVSRARLLSADPALQGVPAVLVRAPAGFGKTSLLAQWRLEHLSRGAVVAWLSAQPQDDPLRLAQSLALAVRQAAGRPTFGHTLLEAAGATDGLEAITVWLAELAQTALDAVLIVDEAERLPQASREALAYLLRNAPPNLRTLIGARPDCQLDIDDLIAYGQCVEVGPASLRFRLEETLELVHGRFGARVDRNAAARLHELTEGWPLGLQLALTIMARGGAGNGGESAGAAEFGGDLAGLSALGDALHGQFIKLLLSKLDAADRDFLVRISVLDPLHPQLCRAATGHADAAERLARLGRDTPVFVAAEQGDWLRMHALARDALRQIFAGLPPAEQAQVHASASHWLAEHGLVEQAARHALTAGEHPRAYELAERSLYESLMRNGRQGAVLDWLAQLPAQELDARPRLLLAAAWTLAASERHEEALRMVDRILALPGVDDALRFECSLVLGGAAVFADDLDRFAQTHDAWGTTVPVRDPLLLQVHANRMAYRALIDGEPALARLRQQQAPRGDFSQGMGYIARWGELLVGLSYIWEGQVLLADSILRPALAKAEGELGRRARFTCMLAALAAAAAWERNAPAEAAALLADRFDVLERGGMPEPLMLAYRTGARMALAEGAEHRALELLDALDAVGAARKLPRLRIASLTEKVRLHARHGHAQTCRELCERIDAMLADPAMPQGRYWRGNVNVWRDLAQGYAAVAARDWRGALAPLERAEALARQRRQGRLQIELLGLRAFALDRCGEPSQGLVREAMDLAKAFGLARVFLDAPPELVAWVAGLQAGDGRPAAPAAAHAARPGPAAEPVAPPPVVAQGMVLTPKEREVLVLLARNLSNKEIGRAMQVGETTIKWHVKNLFAKLDAGTRKQVVQRARILGLIGPES